jgi:hypothetical protein
MFSQGRRVQVSFRRYSDEYLTYTAIQPEKNIGSAATYNEHCLAASLQYYDEALPKFGLQCKFQPMDSVWPVNRGRLRIRANEILLSQLKACFK